jgi:hypothetical protein
MNEFAQQQVIWKKAKLKTAFKYHSYTAIIGVALAWIVWFFSDANSGSIPWPLLLQVVWLIVLALHFLFYKLGLVKLNLTLKEFEKMKG